MYKPTRARKAPKKNETPAAETAVQPVASGSNTTSGSTQASASSSTVDTSDSTNASVPNGPPKKPRAKRGTGRVALKKKAEAEKAAQEKAEQEKAAQEKAEREKAAQEKAAQEKAAQEKAEREKVAREKVEQEKAAQEKAEREQAARANAARERVNNDAQPMPKRVHHADNASTAGAVKRITAAMAPRPMTAQPVPSSSSRPFPTTEFTFGYPNTGTNYHWVPLAWIRAHYALSQHPTAEIYASLMRRGIRRPLRLARP